MGNNPNKKNKNKIVFAKDKKQATMAIAVVVIFVLYSIFLIAKNISYQMPTQNIPQQEASGSTSQILANDPERNPNIENAQLGSDAEQTALTPDPTTVQDPTLASPSSTGEPSPETTNAVAQAQTTPGINPMQFVLPASILFFLLLAGIGLVIYKKNEKSLISEAQGAKNKKKMSFAKSEGQAIAAILVVCLFITNGFYLISKNIASQMPVGTVSQETFNAHSKLKVSQQTETTVGPTTQNYSPTKPDITGPDASLQKNFQATVPTEPIVNPMQFVFPITAILFLIITGAGIAIYKKNAKAIEKQTKETGTSSTKKILPFAKNEQQAIAAIVVAGLFVSNSVYLIAKNIVSQMPIGVVAQAGPQMPSANDPSGQTVPEMSDPTLSQANSLDQNITQDANDIYSQTMNLQGNKTSINTQGALPSTDEIEIMVKGSAPKRNQKMVSIPVSSSGRTNPFLPDSENVSPTSFAYLTSPPETLPSDSDAGKVMTTVISGILYDKYNPSAIINIEGADYLVKKGDLINKYKILSISKDQVLVQLGKNVYKAGVGELLTYTNINYNTIANLNKKFGGNEVSINIKKKIINQE